MKVEELLKIDFSKYEILMLDKVFISLNNNTKVAVVAVIEDGVDIVLEVFIDDNCIVRSFYNKGNEVRIKDLDDECLMIARKE